MTLLRLRVRWICLISQTIWQIEDHSSCIFDRLSQNLERRKHLYCCIVQLCTRIRPGLKLRSGATGLECDLQHGLEGAAFLFKFLLMDYLSSWIFDADSFIIYRLLEINRALHSRMDMYVIVGDREAHTKHMAAPCSLLSNVESF